MADTTTFQVNNIDVASLWRRLNRIVGEVYKAASAQLDYVNQFDLTRLKKYVDSYERELVFIKQEPQVDLPETKGVMEVLEVPEPFAEVENEYYNRTLAFLHRWRLEVVNCQSARQPVGLISHDMNRNEGYVASIRNFIQYIEATQPTDYPATSPQEAQGGSPLSGV